MAGTWPDGELDELLEDVLVDAYGDSEQLGAFEGAFAEVGLPVRAEAVGMECSLDKVEFGGDERRGLVARPGAGRGPHRPPAAGPAPLAPSRWRSRPKP